MKEYIIKEHPDFPYEEPKPPALIRCKDCKNYGTDANRLNCNVFCCSMPENGFCSMAEPKDKKNETES